MERKYFYIVFSYKWLYNVMHLMVIPIGSDAVIQFIEIGSIDKIRIKESKATINAICNFNNRFFIRMPAAIYNKTIIHYKSKGLQGIWSPFII